MGKKINGSEYRITRARYKSIKAFDHQQMEQFCTDVYNSGYQDGRKSVPNIEAEDVIEAVSKIKGIGSKRLEDVRTAIESVFDVAGKRDGVIS